MKILFLGGDDEETTTATNEGGKQRREDRHQHLCLQHWHTEVIEMVVVVVMRCSRLFLEMKMITVLLLGIV